MSVTSSTSTTGGILASPGIGSGLNITALVNGLMQAASIPMTNLNTELQQNQSQISAFGSIQSSLASLQTATQTLYGSGIAVQTASSSNSSAITASSDGTATTGAHTISVSQLAQQQQLTSAGYATNDMTFGGSLTFTVGGTAQPAITIVPNSSLADVVSAINGANTGVNASILNDGVNNHLVLTSANSGAADSFSVAGADSAGSTNLATLNYTAGGALGAGYTSMTTAQDAKLNIDGVAITSASNSVTGALTGVTLNLQTTTASPATMSVAWDSAAIAKTVSSFVSAYNSSVSTLQGTTKYDPSTKTAAVLNGNFLPSSIMSQLGSAMSTTFSQMSTGLSTDFKNTGSFTSIGDLGVALNGDGTLTLDSTKLNKALTSNPSGFMAAFSDFGKTLNTTLQSQLDPVSGSLTSMNSSLQSQQKSITNDQTAMQAHLDALQAQYTAQFNALDSMLASMQQTSSTLTAQLNGLSSNSR